MALFGIGGSKQKSKSESFGLDVSRSRSGSQDVSTSRQGSRSTQDIAFRDLFQSLYSNAATAAAGAAAGGPGIGNAASMLFSGGTDFLEQLQGGDASAYLEARMRGEGGLVDEQIAALKSDLGSLFSEELNPAIAGEAVAAGGYGGGRQGVAQGIAVGKIAEQFTKGATAIRGADIASRDAAARDLYGLRTDAAKAGISALPSLLDLKQKGQLAELAPYQALASIFGGPTVLGESSSFGRSDSEAIARSISDSFGFDTSKATSKGKSGSIGFG